VIVRLRILVALIVCAVALPLAVGADWTGFRGPAGTGVSEEQQLPTEWGKDKNLAWKVKIPGAGWSQPVVVGDKVFVTSAVTENQKKPTAGGGFGGMGGKGGFGKGTPPNSVYKWEVTCLDQASGKVLWKELALERKPTHAIHSTNTYATETPVTDGERIYVYFGMTGLFCYDLAGKQLWKKDLGTYSTAASFGTGSSPVLAGDKLIVQCDNEEKSFLIALDKKTGEEAWKVSRDDRTSYCTPFVWKNKERTEIVTGAVRHVRSYDPANGKVLWEMSIPAPTGGGGGFGGRGFGGGQANSSPTGDDEMIYFGISAGMGASGPLYAVKAGAKGDISLKSGDTSSDFVAWSASRSGPAMSSPLVYQGYLYILSGQGGTLSCYEAKTGKSLYKERLPGSRGFTGSPCAADGKIFCVNEDSQTYVIQAGKDFKVLSKNSLDGEMFWSSPAVANGTLLLRGVDTLYCIKK
jgi:outer membrane protein assembly factor BamB